MVAPKLPFAPHIPTLFMEKSSSNSSAVLTHSRTSAKGLLPMRFDLHNVN